jgi:hypothetical protein
MQVRGIEHLTFYALLAVRFFLFKFKIFIMIYFQRINNRYQLDDGTELPTNELLKFAHEIDGDDGAIFVNLKRGDKVYKHPSTLELDVHSDLPTGIISRFTVFGGTLCARFEETNVPHDVRCLSAFNHR